MVDLDCKTKRVSSDMHAKSPRLSNKLIVSIPMPPTRVAELAPACDSACDAYEHYLRLPELKKLWTKKEFSDWKNEDVLKPAFQALEITFRFVSVILSDPRTYTNTMEWKRRLEGIGASQIEVISLLAEEDERAPIIDLSAARGFLAREGSSVEVWKLDGGDTATIVNPISEASLLPRLLTWQKSEYVAQKMLYAIECNMMNCPYALGLGEPNLRGKPSLDYDVVCKPNDLHSQNRPYTDQIDNYENKALFATHQILESWIYVARRLLDRVVRQIEAKKYEIASNYCWLLEKVWKLLTEIEDLNLLMDPDDFLKLKSQLSIETTSESESLCFRSRALVDITKACKELKHKVPEVLEVEVDPTGGPRIQEAAMKLYKEEKNVGMEKIHLLQGLQAVEAAVKKFYFSYKQLLVIVMGSLEAKGNDERDSLAQIFLEPTYFPSLDGAKTFLGDYYRSCEKRAR